MKFKLTLVLLVILNYCWAQDISKESLPGNVFRFDFQKFERQFREARVKKEKISQVFIELPTENGKNIRFSLKENNLTEQRLQPIITFDGVSDDKTASLKLSVFEDHFNAIIKNKAGYFFVDRYKTAPGEYRIYNAFSDFGERFFCGVEESDLMHELSSLKQNLNTKSAPNFPFGNQIRKFRLAAATTGEFTQAFNGNTDNALAEAVNIVNLINKIYESEVSVTFSLIAETTNKTLVFTDPATDPFTVDPNFANAANSQTGFNTLNTNGTLVYNKYDIGHTFNILSSGGARGQAGPQPCNNTSKSRAWSEWALSMPKGTVAGLIAHEMGHQFSAGHTYNAVGGSASSPTFCTSGWNSSAAVEPGSGTTIMGYNSNCSIPNNQNNTGDNSLDYFNAKSLDQILAYLQSPANCYTLVASPNTVPTANAGTDITIPKNTPFKLKGTASDPNDSNLSYTWEQADVATANDKGAFGSTITGTGGYTAVNSTTAPLFRSEQSTLVTERYFPKMKFVLNNQNNPPTNDAEALPLVARTMKFRFTVRDNNPTNGGLDSDEIIVTVDNSGPLAVTYPNAAGISLASNTLANITWDVNNTNTIKSNVDILLSIDGGLSFPYTLASNVLNNGSSNVTIPYIPTTNKARIKVVGVINPNAEFFDVSDNNFTITSDCNAYSTYITPQTAVSAISGSPEANLNMSAPPAASDTYTAKTFAYNTASSNNNIIVYSDASMAAPYSGPSNYVSNTFKFRVTDSGNYTFSKSSGFLITSVHSGNPASTANFLASNSYYNGSSYTANGSTKSVTLNEGVDYYLICTNFSSPANSTSYTITATGPGSLYETLAAPAGYSYIFIAVNNSTGKIDAVNTTANFTSLQAGTYTVKGISYNSTANTSDFIGKSINELIALNICLNESKNTRSLSVTSSLNTKAVKNNSGIKVVPNPVKDLLSVITDKQITHYEIYDMSGRNLTDKQKYSGKISFTAYSSGSYIIRFFNKENLVYQTTIIKK
ncbi:T9SS type A sorting domain-containing protein [Chryseobacterium sp. Tr-659]|uniref:zinc-dependent metalloprotease n=1 Tax=Chryseobacterium sp. Tr-659 TaxID=2608340 RepID=UPI00141F1D44|nr:zinc-dependent metalloprotease [Chryseobacterium sp. Tr-659]NIF06993.1 T9SS type A sorting domain-containing protein [Chryseobacterium sp. Tr-659]